MSKEFFFFFFVAITLASAKPVQDEFIRIRRFGYEIARDEDLQLKSVKDEDGKDQQVVVVEGSFSYPDPQGNPITVVFFADETGFHADGAHFPVAPVV